MAKEKKRKQEEKKVTPFITPVLLIFLVGVSFGVGVLWSRLRGFGLGRREESESVVKQALEFEVEEEEEVKEKIAQASPTQGQPAVLGEKEMAQLEEGAAGSKGEDDALVTIVEFSEYLCPYCAEYVGVDAIPQQPIDQGGTYQRIMTEYVATGKVRYVFQDFPVHGQPAMERGAAARCAGEQGRYWEYHDLLFEKIKEQVGQDELREKLVGWAVTLGLDEKQFSACLEKEEYLQAVKDSYELGLKVGVSGTPTFFVNGQKLRGAQPFESFQKIIEEELK